MKMPPTRSFAVVPAAGRSVRMGQPKLLLPWGKTTIIEQVLAAWRSAGVSHTIVVAHRDDLELVRVVRAASATVVVPDVPPPQMKDSVQAALHYIDTNLQPTTLDVWLLAPADVPTLSPRVISALVKEHDPGAPTILVPRHQSRRGHPVLIPWVFAARVHALSASQGINALVEAGPTRNLDLGAEATPADVDTPADFSRHQRELEQKKCNEK